MRSIFLLALGLASSYPAVAAPESFSLREECTRDRCVYYRGSLRQFSVEREYGTERLVLRNGARDIVAKVKRQAGGTIKVEGTNRRR